MEREKNSRNLIQSLERAFRILEQFDLKTDELAITEIADRVDLPISTVHRFLATLESLGYIRQNEDNGKYRLGLNAFILGTRVKTLEEIRSVARTYLRDLFDKYNETTHFVVERHMEVLCVEKIDAHRRLVYTPGVGETNRLYATSVGKCIMAFAYDDEKLESVIRSLKPVPLTERTITDRKALREEVRRVRTQGYAIDSEESEIGLVCYGAPVFGHGGRCVGAISVSFPIPRMTYTPEQIIADVRDVAARMSAALGAR